MKNKAKINVFLIILTSLSIYQKPIARGYDIKNREKLIFIDTIGFEDHVIISFKSLGSNKGKGTLLVSSKDLESINPSDTILTLTGFLSKYNSYLFITPSRFTCILNSCKNNTSLKNDTLFLKEVEKTILNSIKDTIWKPIDKTQKNTQNINGWEFFNIYPDKFLLFLVEAASYNKCRVINEIKLQNIDKIYVPLLVPITR